MDSAPRTTRPPAGRRRKVSDTRATSEPRRPREGDPLTAREVEVLALVATGESTRAISRRLGIAENTIKTHLTSVYRKTGSQNRVQAARHYLETYEEPRARR